ncbi:hypothetical protein WJX73_001252 [Symbiochloris irregularis]|uniref:Uncharacterized protein n=1 Tax=Symbiochloris irregularis TaxID=706552 RepID=A0AAW1PB94_9CHLO
MFEGLSTCLSRQEDRLRCLLERLDKLDAQVKVLASSHKVLHSSSKPRYPALEADHDGSAHAFFRGDIVSTTESDPTAQGSPPYFEHAPAVAGKDTLEIYHHFRRPGREPNVADKARPEDTVTQGSCSCVSSLYPFDPSSYSAHAHAAAGWGQGQQPPALAEAQVHEGTRVEHLAASLYRLSTGSAAGALQAAEAESSIVVLIGMADPIPFKGLAKLSAPPHGQSNA